MVTKRRTTKKAGDIKMFITNTGKVFSDADLKRYEIPQTKQIIQEGKFGAEVIEPPYDLAKLMAWLEVNVVHSSCVRTKTQDSVGIGWHLAEVDDHGLTDERLEQEKEALSNFFVKCNENEDITSVMKKAFLEYEGCGNGYLELVRGDGTESDVLEKSIKSIYHVNATTVRWHKDKDKFLQRMGVKKVYFKCFGDDRVLNKDTGAFGKVAKPENVANELIQVKQYTWRSHWYGLPEWISAIVQMYGQMKEAEYNLDFFTNYGVPAYAVIIKGMKMNTTVEETIKKYFETEVKADPHKTMVFGLPSGGEIVFEKLSVEAKESSFNIYRKDTRDDILTAHHVPPYRASIVEKGQLGGSVAEDVDRIYLDSVINPRQWDFEWIINQLIIKEGFGITSWQFRFDDIDIDDKKIQAEIDDKYLQIGVLTPNQIRKKLGLEEYEGGDTYYVAGNLVPVGQIEVIEEKTDESDYIDEDLEGMRDEAIAKYIDATSWRTDEDVSLLNHPDQKKFAKTEMVEQGRFLGGTFREVYVGNGAGILAIVGKLQDGEIDVQCFLRDKIKK